MLAEQVLEIARGEVGVQEVPRGTNWGPRVKEYILAAGYDAPAYWCLCFAYWAVAQAAHDDGAAVPIPRTGSCDVLFNWAERQERLFQDPEPGDIFLVMAGTDNAIHAGFVESLDGASVNTIEGNSNTDGSSNGYEVVKRSRSIHNLQFVRYADAEAAGFTLIVGGQPVTTMPAIDGITYAPVRLVAAKLGFDSDLVTWDNDAQGIRFRGHLIAATAVIHNGVGFVPVRILASFFGLSVTVDPTAKTVTLSK